MATKKVQSKKAIERAIDAAYTRHAQGIQVNILDIPKIFEDAEKEIAAGRDLDEAMIEIVKRYRVN